MARSVFYGVSAFVGSITAKMACAFWPDDPNNLNPPFAQNALFAVDLSKNPEGVRRGTVPVPVAGQPSQVEVDDFAGYGTGGLTTIGPMFPGGATQGLCYVEESRCGALGPYDPRNAGPGQPYEWCTVVYYDTSGGHPAALVGRRFHGFHAQILKANGNMALVSLWARGTSATKPPMGTWWVDLNAFGHPPGLAIAGFTQIGINTPQQIGALFIDMHAGHGGVIKFDEPKTPRGYGGLVIRGGHRAR